MLVSPDRNHADDLGRPGSHSVAPDNYIAVVEYAPTSYSDSVVRLYEVGRKKPDAYDSDLDEDDELPDDYDAEDAIDHIMEEDDYGDIDEDIDVDARPFLSRSFRFAASAYLSSLHIRTDWANCWAVMDCMIC